MCMAISFPECQFWRALWWAGANSGSGSSMLWWTGLLLFFSPFLSQEWFFNLPWTGVSLCSYPSCWRQFPVLGEPWEGWLNHLQRSLRICFTSNSFLPDTDIVAGGKTKAFSHRKETAFVISCFSASSVGLTKAQVSRAVFLVPPSPTVCDTLRILPAFQLKQKAAANSVGGTPYRQDDEVRP